MNLIITTVQKTTLATEQMAKEFAEKLHAPFIARNKLSLDSIKAHCNADIVLVTTNNGPIVYTPSGSYYFHLSMAELRIKNILDGKNDHMVTAMNLQPGLSVLDCTLGLGSDAIVAGVVVGKSGNVVGLESSPIMASVVEYGLAKATSKFDETVAAMRRIRVICMDHYEYLRNLPDKSYDVVYFDPMFRQTIYGSSNVKPLRHLADPRPLSAKTLQEARRIARMRVVVKETQNSTEFNRLAITSVIGGKYSSIQYGILETGLE